MNDKELLELAAKAAGYGKLGLYWSDRTKCLADGEGFYFDPLTDDGDALRLAVDLSLFDGLEKAASNLAAEVNFDLDPYAATRRAIVQAAAEIGRSMG